jgi:hypothetical protein
MNKKLVKIYCEGKKGSHDYDVLDKVLSDLNISIQPIGSKKGAGSAIQVYEQLAVDRSDAYLFFRDRDFDAPVPLKPALVEHKFTYYSYRTTIENYLFDVIRFHDFILEKKLQHKYQLYNVMDVQNLFTDAAKGIAYYQAIRHTMGKMRIPTDFGTTWLVGGSGTLPTREELKDRDFCKAKAWEKVAAAKKETDNWTTQLFNEQLDIYYNQFNDIAFYVNADFLIWFQGKDFSLALGRLLPEFPMKNYYQFSKKYFDYTAFQDLIQLRQIVQQLMEP